MRKQRWQEYNSDSYFNSEREKYNQVKRKRRIKLPNANLVSVFIIGVMVAIIFLVLHFVMMGVIDMRDSARQKVEVTEIEDYTSGSDLVYSNDNVQIYLWQGK